MDPHDGLPPAIARAVRHLTRTGNDVLYCERAATEREMEFAKETGQRAPEIVREEVGALSDVAALGRLEELRQLLPKDLEPNLKGLAELDLTDAGDAQLNHWAKWAGEVEAKLARAVAIIDEARQFFTRENIAVLAELCTDKADERAVMALARRYWGIVKGLEGLGGQNRRLSCDGGSQNEVCG